MTVSVLAQNKIKIILTHTEVISCFGEYSKLCSLTPLVKTSLTMLFSDIIASSNVFPENCKISAKIKVKESVGCEITLTAFSPGRKAVAEEWVFLFPDSESLTKALIELYKAKSNLRFQSHLYKNDSSYCLFLRCKNAKERFFWLNEFCFGKTNDAITAAHIKEYGKPLILNCAIEKYGKAFLK